MKYLMVPFVLLAIFVILTVTTICCILSFPIALIKGIYKENVKDELNDWWEIYSYMYQWAINLWG